MNVDFSLAMIMTILRRLSNDKCPVFDEIIASLQVTLVEILGYIPQMNEFDDEVEKYFILVEEILLHLHKFGNFKPRTADTETLILKMQDSIVNQLYTRIDSIALIKWSLALYSLMMLMIGEPNQTLV